MAKRVCREKAIGVRPGKGGGALEEKGERKGKRLHESSSEARFRRNFQFIRVDVAKRTGWKPLGVSVARRIRSLDSLQLS